MLLVVVHLLYLESSCFLFFLLAHGVEVCINLELVKKLLDIYAFALLLFKLLAGQACFVFIVAFQGLDKNVGCFYDAVHISVAAVGHTWNHEAGRGFQTHLALGQRFLQFFCALMEQSVL